MGFCLVFDSLLNEHVLGEVDAVQVLRTEGGDHHEQSVLLVREEPVEACFKSRLVLEFLQVAFLGPHSVLGEREVDVECLRGVDQGFESNLVNPRRGCRDILVLMSCEALRERILRGAEVKKGLESVVLVPLA